MKWCGDIGFSIPEKTKPGVFTPVVKTKKYYGDIIRNSHRYDAGEKVNEDISLNNVISIVMDQFAYDNSQYIRYVSWGNSKWKVTSVDINYPRMNLSIGGVWNGPRSTPN